MKKLYTNAYAFAAACALFIAACVFTVFTAASWAAKQITVYNGQPMAESWTERYIGSGTGYDIIGSEYGLNPYVYVPSDNIGWTLSILDTEKNTFVKAKEHKAQSSADQIAERNFAWYVSNGELNLWPVEREENALNSLASVKIAEDARIGYLTIVLKQPLSSRDAMYDEYALYTIAERFSDHAGIRILLSMALIIMLSIYLCTASGRRKYDDRIHLNFMDSIWYEIVIIAAGAGMFICILCAAEALREFSSFTSELMIVCEAVCASAFFLILLIAALSAVRRIKAGTFWQSTAIGKLYGIGMDLVQAVPQTPLTAMSAFFLLCLNIWSSLFAHPSIGMYAVIVLDLIAFLYFIWRIYGTHVIARASAEIASGNTDYRADDPLSARLPLDEKEILVNLESVSEGIRTAVEKQMKSEHMKTELITNVSHDIKTPLTSIISYTDLLSKEEDPEKQKEYIDVLRRSSTRLKKLTEDLVEASKASTGNLPVEINETDIHEIIEQAAGEYEDRLMAAELTPVITCGENLKVLADGKLLWRILSNLLSNCVKYAQSGTRVYIDAAHADENNIRVSIKNISRDILNISSDELMERFVRGDRARNSEGSGLGLDIARSLTELMNGRFEITIDGDLFRADVILPASDADPSSIA